MLHLVKALLPLRSRGTWVQPRGPLPSGQPEIPHGLWGWTDGPGTGQAGFLGFSKRMCCAGKQPRLRKAAHLYTRLSSAPVSLGKDKAWLSPGRRSPPGSGAGALCPTAFGPEGCPQVTGDTGRVTLLPSPVSPASWPWDSASHLLPLPPVPVPSPPTTPEIRFQQHRPGDVARGCGGELGLSAALTWAPWGAGQSTDGPGRSGAGRKALPGLSPEASPTHRGRATPGSGVPGESGRDAGRPPLRRPIQRAAGKESGLAGRPLAVAGSLPIECLQTAVAPPHSAVQLASFSRLFPFSPFPAFNLLQTPS